MEPPGFEPGTSGLDVVPRAFVASFMFVSMATRLVRVPRLPEPRFEAGLSMYSHRHSPPMIDRADKDRRDWYILEM